MTWECKHNRNFCLELGGLAASMIARALGPAFVGGFGKALGGPAVIAAALAVAAGPALSLFNLGEVQCVRRIYLH